MNLRAFPALRILPVVGLALLGAACAATAEDDASSVESEVTRRHSPYPMAIRAMRRLDEPFTPKNFSLEDPNNAVRNQGKIGSCASHGFLGMIENQMFIDRGITLDLSERYMLYANFMETGNMGNMPAVIMRFAEIASTWGIFPESAWAYDALAPNAHRFELDHAQGLATDASAVTIDKAIAGTKDGSKKRSTILQQPQHLGALPDGRYPVVLPMKAHLSVGARVPEIEYEGKIVPCFAENGAEGLPADKTLAVTPRELAKMCFDLEPTRYFACNTDLAAIAAGIETNPQADECTKAIVGAEVVGRALAEGNQKRLGLTLSLLDRGQAVMAGVYVPREGGASALWSSEGLAWGGGHAVVIVGYLTDAELGNVDEQERGLLGKNIFDELAVRIEPEMAARFANRPTTKSALRDLRRSTKLGAILAKEGGLLLFRNSWGAKIGDVEIGFGGYQAMTFDYFLKSGTLAMSRSNDAVQGVSWEDGAGPVYCPTVTAPLTTDPFVSADPSERVLAFMRGLAIPPACR